MERKYQIAMITPINGSLQKIEKQYNLKVAGENRNLNQSSIFKPVDYTKGNIKTQLSS
jgi:hypothetical protein